MRRFAIAVICTLMVIVPSFAWTDKVLSTVDPAFARSSALAGEAREASPPMRPADQPAMSCPQTRYIDCMPPVSAARRAMCGKQYLEWLKVNCPGVEVVY